MSHKVLAETQEDLVRLDRGCNMKADNCDLKRVFNVVGHSGGCDEIFDIGVPIGNLLKP